MDQSWSPLFRQRCQSHAAASVHVCRGCPIHVCEREAYGRLRPMIDGSAVRRRLDAALRTDADLESFCLDCFPEIHRRFGGQMERTVKLNLLLQLVPDHAQILDRLERYSAGSSTSAPFALAEGPAIQNEDRTVDGPAPHGSPPVMQGAALQLSPLNLDGLIRSMGVNSPCRHMLLLGAGASITSGIPSGWHCIWEWKAEIFISSQPHVPQALLGDPSLPHVQDRIQAWIDAAGDFPQNGAPNEYQFFAERCYPEARDRQKYFEKLITEGTPSLGYKLLSLLIEAGHFRWIWTTNFDNMIERARYSEHKRIIRIAGMDTRTRTLTVEPDDQALQLVFLHGDFRYDRLRNTASELQALHDEFRGQLSRQCLHYPLVVVGYSGRDDSVMKTLEIAYGQRGEGGLYWLGMRGSKLHPRVRELITTARAHGRRAEYIEYDGFDALMHRLSGYLLREEPWAGRVRELIQSGPPPKTSFSLSNYHPTDQIVKSNSWQVIAPAHLYELRAPVDIQSWADLHERVSKSDGRVCAGLLKGKIIAMGNQSEILACFGREVGEQLAQVPISPKELFFEDGVVVSVLREGLVRSLATGGLRAATEHRRWYLFDPSKRATYRWGNDVAVYYPAVLMRFEQRAGQLFLSLIPEPYLPSNEQPATLPERSLAPLKAELVGKQWNKTFNADLNMWRRQLGLTTARECVFPAGHETGFRYKILSGPLIIQVYDRTLSRSASAPRGASSLYQHRFKAFELPEPELQFARGRDLHPIRGLTQSGPIELSAGFASPRSELRLGIICPDSVTRQLVTFLSALHNPHRNIETKAEYLYEYPGFATAFQLPLRTPQPSEEGWVTVPSQTRSGVPSQAFQELSERITAAIDRLAAGSGVDVVLIFIPSSWAPFESVETETLDLDLHDQIKAYCAVRGIRTQFLQERTLVKRQRAEVLWWLALALYAKSMRTPWILARPQEDVAYVGIGYAVDRCNRAQPIVLGCSHVFQSNGLGLRFHLSQVQDPIWRGKKPYLGRDDALRVGLQTRQFFYESLGRLPSRVLLCKRTPFIKEELSGLRAGLTGISSIDFLTLEYEPAWRCLAYDKRTQDAAPFPVRRGTGILMDDETFYLWFHGRVDRINNEGKTYYQGKTRIPAPVRVRRYGGSSTIEQLAKDLLGLSKMDWNTFDLYEQMPAHITTPGRIARIGRLIQRLDSERFDYRLFM